MENIPKRFWDKVNKTNSCWLWTAYKNHDGYGQFGLKNRKAIGAHRYLYIELYGPIPEGMCVCHTCDNRGCVNPDHLWLGTHRDNMKDRMAKKRDARGQRNGNVKLTDNQVRKIKKHLTRKDISRKEICRKFNIAYPTLCQIAYNITWRDVV